MVPRIALAPALPWPAFAADTGRTHPGVAANTLETERLHGQIFDAVADPLVVWEGTRVVAANPAALHLFDLDAPVQRKRRGRGVRIALDTGVLGELAGNGRRIEGLPVRDRNGQSTGISVDVTPLATGGALLHFRVRTESIARELWTDDAVTTVAHEFRAPLASMRSALNLLVAGDAGELQPDQLRFVRTVQRGAERLARIVDGYLDLGRVRARSLALARQEEDVRGMLDSLVTDLTACHPALGARLVVEVADEVGCVFADRDRVTQVLLNLVYNAARFTPGEKRVSLHATRAGREVLDDRMRVLPFELLGQPDFTCIEVEDEGIGMSADVLAHIFDRYHVDAGDDGHPGDGAHLGLHIARALVDAHDGWMCIDSRLGEGTTARVFLPTDAATARLMARLDEAEEAVQIARASHDEVTVVLLEDDGIRADVAPAARPDVGAPSVDARVEQRVIRDGLALWIVRGELPDVPATLMGACRMEAHMTFSGAIRAAAARLLEQKDGRADAPCPVGEPVRE